MICIADRVVFVAQSFFTGAGFSAAWWCWEPLPFLRKHRFLWLPPAILLCSWLESGLAAPQGGPVTYSWRMLIDMLAWFGVSAVAVGVRRAARNSGRGDVPQGDKAGWLKTDLMKTVEAFVGRVDRSDLASIEAAYAASFVCVRVADSGGFARLDREQMLAIQRRHKDGSNSTPSVVVRETKMHHSETVGDIGLVVMTRTKDIGTGWEPMFYLLVWEKTASGWRLLREFVHQKSEGRAVMSRV